MTELTRNHHFGSPQAILLLFVLAVCSVGCRRAGAPRAGAAENVAKVSSALTIPEVMSFEDPSGWSTTTAGAVLSRSTTHSEGSFSLQLRPSNTNGFTPIQSAPVAQPALIGSRLAFDIMLPTTQVNPSWFGTAQMILDCPSRNIIGAFLAQVELTGRPLGVFTTVEFPLTNQQITALLNPGYTDLRFTVVVNVQVPTTGVYRVDNLRFLPAATNGCLGLPNGTACNDNSACTSGDVCQAGVCTGAPVTCTADACHTVGACVPATGCPAPVARPNGAACNDGNACTSGDTCQTGMCTSGAPVTCTTDACHTVGACAPATGCPAPVARPNGTACNDGNACTSADSCQTGICTGGVPVACSTDACHTVGACVPATGCPAPVVRANGTTCSDGNACTSGDTCQTGSCTAGGPVTCTTDACHTVGACIPATGCPAPVARPNGTTCNDANACTSGDSCQAGVCRSGAPVTCTTDACHTVGACAPATGCPTPVVRPNGATCSDGNACTSGDSCQAGSCTAGAPVTCSADACHTVGACVPGTGCPAPVPKANGTTCDDANACTLSDRCQDGACTGDAKTCAPANACELAGACDPATGDCTNPARPDPSRGAVAGFNYDGAGRQTQDGDADLIYDGFDELREIRPRDVVAPKLNDGTLAVALRHSYCYDGIRASTTAPGPGGGQTQYWFTEDYTEHDGQRDHYVRVGSRLIAKVTMIPTTGGAAAPPPAEPRAPLPPRVPLSPSLGSFVALLLAVLATAAAFAMRLRRLRWRTACVLGALSALASASCNLLRSDGEEATAGLGWGVSDTSYFQQGLAAGPVLMTNASGGVLEERRYEPFGQAIDARRGTNPVGNVDFRLEPQNILGKQTDPNTGWSYHGARWMAPQTARWLTPDPAVMDPSAALVAAPWDLNPYQYARQAPTTFWDPDGMRIDVVEAMGSLAAQGIANPTTSQIYSEAARLRPDDADSQFYQKQDRMAEIWVRAPWWTLDKIMLMGTARSVARGAIYVARNPQVVARAAGYAARGAVGAGRGIGGGARAVWGGVKSGLSWIKGKLGGGGAKAGEESAAAGQQPFRSIAHDESLALATRASDRALRGATQNYIRSLERLEALKQAKPLESPGGLASPNEVEQYMSEFAARAHELAQARQAAGKALDDLLEEMGKHLDHFETLP